jgi:hypothetical protein
MLPVREGDPAAELVPAGQDFLDERRAVRLETKRHSVAHGHPVLQALRTQGQAAAREGGPYALAIPGEVVLSHDLDDAAFDLQRVLS